MFRHLPRSCLLLLVPLVVEQLTGFLSSPPALLGGLHERLLPFYQELQQRFNLPDLAELADMARARMGSAMSWLAAALEDPVPGMALASLLSLVFITPVVAFYLLRDWDHIVAKMDGLLPRDHAAVIREQVIAIDRTMAGFARGQATVCLALGAYYASALMIVGLPFGLFIGVAAGLLTFIPYVGATSGFVVSLAIALGSFEGWERTAAVVGIFAVGQVLEGNVLTPKLVGEKSRVASGLDHLCLARGRHAVRIRRPAVGGAERRGDRRAGALRLANIAPARSTSAIVRSRSPRPMRNLPARPPIPKATDGRPDAYGRTVAARSSGQNRPRSGGFRGVGQQSRCRGLAGSLAGLAGAGLGHLRSARLRQVASRPCLAVAQPGAVPGCPTPDGPPDSTNLIPDATAFPEERLFHLYNHVKAAGLAADPQSGRRPAGRLVCRPCFAPCQHPGDCRGSTGRHFARRRARQTLRRSPADGRRRCCRSSGAPYRGDPSPPPPT